MGSFNREKFDDSFNPKKYELDKKQSTEMRSLLDKHKSAGTTGSASFYDSRIEMRKRHFSNFIELAVNSLAGSISHKVMIDDSDREEFEVVLNEISMNFLELEKNSLKASMVSHGNTVDSLIVTESVKAYEKQLAAIKTDSIKLLDRIIANHNNGLFENKSGKKEVAWKKYTMLIIIALVLTAICFTVLYLVL